MYPSLILDLDEVGNLPIESSCMLEDGNGFPLVVGHLGDGYYLAVKEYLTAVVGEPPPCIFRL